MKTIASLLALVATALQASAIDYVIEAEVPDSEGKTFIVTDYDTRANIDSAVVVNGKLRIAGSYARPALVRVSDGKAFTNCVLDSLAVIDFGSGAPVAGSDANRRLKAFMDAYAKINDDVVEFGNRIKGQGLSQEEGREKILEYYRSRRPDFLNLFSETIASNGDDGTGYAAMMMLSNFFELTPEEWEAAYLRFPENLKATNLAVSVNTKFTNLRRSQEGMPFIDFTAKTPDGLTRSLSDYVGKGKYVLVDFWASWCGPCKKEAKEVLMPLYERMKGNDKFEILGVAVWDKPDATLRYLEKAGYPWPQLIDAGEEPMRLYGSEYVPFIVLFGPDGKILKRSLRGEELVSTVESLF